MNAHYLGAFIFAGLAALGNAMFVYGQKRAEISESPFIFLILALFVCVALLLLTSNFFPKVSMTQYLLDNKWFVALSGVGFYLTYIGFYYLFIRYGASYYSLYAVMSILTTSILVGVYLFKETLNLFYVLSILAALLTIVFFALGQSRAGV